jgi:BirA family biotin operon repressor/biotin-[acetyl-CoA-carboxylase] ligase
MGTLFMGRNLVDLPETESTQTLAEQFLTSQPPEGTVILTRHQTAGRGQAGNSWFSKPGLNLTFSTILYPRFLPLSGVFQLNRWASVAVAEALDHFLPQGYTAIKWPNDVLVNRKKICGMLFQNTVEGSSVKSAIVGIGINVNQREFPAEAGKATSLVNVLGQEVSPDDLLAVLLEKMEAGYLALRSGRTAALEAEYLKRLYGYQETLTFRIGGEEVQAHLVGVEAGGRLALEREGKISTFDLKQVSFIL